VNKENVQLNSNTTNNINIVKHNASHTKQQHLSITKPQKQKQLSPQVEVKANTAVNGTDSVLEELKSSTGSSTKSLVQRKGQNAILAKLRFYGFIVKNTKEFSRCVYVCLL